MALSDDIDHFLADRTVQGAIEASRESRPLQICYPREIPVSRFLGWVLDPTQGHGLNASVIRRLLTACWQTATDEAVSPKLRKQIAPSRLNKLSFADVVIDREVNLNDGTGRLDVLVLVPGIRLLIAIENKVGARESRNQLAKYREGLQTRFEGWDQILVFLDMNGMQPADAAWVGLEYDWLVDELTIAEKSIWLGDEPRRSIAEFRHAIDVNSPTESLVGIDEQSLLEMVLNHKNVFTLMAAWATTKKSRADLLATVFNDKSPDGLAGQSLLPIYCRRVRLWQECSSMIAYAQYKKAARDSFGDCECDPKRSAFYFFLSRWQPLMDAEAQHWPLNVMIRERFEVPENERFVVVSHLILGSVAEEFTDRVVEVAESMRSTKQRAKKISPGAGYTSLRVDYCSSAEQAATKMQTHLKELDRAFSPICTSST
jgi:hypothetical protein